MNISDVKKLPIPHVMRKALPELLIKNIMLESEFDGIETLALGHSQGGHAFNPTYFPLSFNACSRSQDMKMSYQMYEKFGAKLPRLKRVILFYSFIAPGFLAENIETERAIAVAFNEVYKINHQFEDDYLDLLSNDIKDLFNEVSCNYHDLGYDGKSGYIYNADATYFENTYWQRRRLPQLYSFNLHDAALPYLNKIIALALERKHQIYFAVAPNRSDTIAGTPGASIYLHRHLIDALSHFKLQKENIFIDFYGSPYFQDQDFGDFTHLLLGGTGAELLTKEIHGMVERNER